MRTYGQRLIADGVLQVWDVSHSARRRVQPLVLNSSDHADDSVPGSIVIEQAKAYALAERAFVRPVLARQPFVNDRHAWRVARIGVGERASGEQGDLHRAEVMRRDDA